MKTLNKAINPSQNTNPFNHDTSYIKLYNSVKDGTRDMNEYGQLINPRYLDDVFNFKTSLSPLTRKVRVELRGELYLRMFEVQVFAYDGTNKASGKAATQSPDRSGGGSPASNAVDGKSDTASHTTTNPGKYIPQVSCIILIFNSLLSSVSI